MDLGGMRHLTHLKDTTKYELINWCMRKRKHGFAMTNDDLTVYSYLLVCDTLQRTDTWLEENHDTVDWEIFEYSFLFLRPPLPTQMTNCPEVPDGTTVVSAVDHGRELFFGGDAHYDNYTTMNASAWHNSMTTDNRHFHEVASRDNWMSQLPHACSSDYREPLFTFMWANKEFGFYSLSIMYWAEMLVVSSPAQGNKALPFHRHGSTRWQYFTARAYLLFRCVPHNPSTCLHFQRLCSVKPWWRWPFPFLSTDA